MNKIDKKEKVVICQECGCGSFAVFIAANYISIRCNMCKGVKTIIEDNEQGIEIKHE